MKFEIDPNPIETPPDPTPPEGGWVKPSCTFESHHWEMEVDDGRASISCTDPCNPYIFDPREPTPICLHDWEPEDFHTPDPIPVALTFVDDSTPSTPAGSAEYGYYIEVRTGADVGIH
jgi:hypothetical protein